MKIGVAFSGSGMGAPWSHLFMEELRICAIPIGLLSVTSLAAVPALLWAKGLTAPEIEKWMHEIVQNPAEGCRKLGRSRQLDRALTTSVAVSSVDVRSRAAILFTDGMEADAWNLKAYPLAGNEADALSAAVCPYGGMEPPTVDGRQLCDFSVRYGSPFFPLKMAGMERILSVSFAGSALPAQAAGDHMAAWSGRNSDLHFTLQPESPESAQSYIHTFLQNHKDLLYQKLLF